MYQVCISWPTIKRWLPIAWFEAKGRSLYNSVTLLLLNEMLNSVSHLNALVKFLDTTPNSKPVFLTLPTFNVFAPIPTLDGCNTLNNKSLVFLL
ncbi:hypothetical protein D3C78_1278940 [compost metagenome]